MTDLLFYPEQLSALLQRTVTDDAALAAEGQAWGWLSDATGLTERPDPVTPDLLAWALELGAMAYDNPTSLDRRQIDDVVLGSSAGRREEILRAAAGASDVSDAGAPTGCFPAAQAQPDPITVGRCGYGYGYGNLSWP